VLVFFRKREDRLSGGLEPGVGSGAAGEARSGAGAAGQGRAGLESGVAMEGREGLGQLAGREGLASKLGSGEGWGLDDTTALNLLASLLLEILRSSFLLRPP